MANITIQTMETRLLFFLASILIYSFQVSGQSTKGQFNADSIFIYNNYKEHGSTANLWHNHRDLDSSNASKIKLSSDDQFEFVEIFKYTQGKKLYQQKYGGDICYLLIYNKGQKIRCVLYASPEFGTLHDLDTMKYWSLKNAEDKRRFYELVRKNWP